MISLEKIVNGGRRMRLFKKDDFVIRDNKMVLVPLGDVHAGSKHCKLDEFEKNIQWIYDTPNVYVLGMGDLIETGTKSSIGGSIYEQNSFVQEQLEYMVSVLTPLVKRKKILGLLDGNHERRIYNEDGLNLTKIMCMILGIPYFGNSIFMDLKVGSARYSLFATHGSSGAKLDYTKIKACTDLAAFNSADIYCYGHVHTTNHLARTYHTIDTRSGIVKECDRHFVITGHYLGYFDSYAEAKNLAPGKRGSPKIKFNASDKEIRVSL